MKFKKVIWLIGASLLLSSCLKETDLPMAADFRATAKNDRQTAPVTMQLSNLSYGADTYMWTFEGGNPSSSSDKNPGEVVFAEAGNHKITLTAVNAVGQSVKDTTITVYPQVSVGFGYVVQINDIAPAVVEIVNKTKGATAYEWHFEGGDPATSSSPNPGCVTFATGGKHEIRLRVTNGLEWFEQSDTVTLRNPMRADFEMQPLGIDDELLEFRAVAVAFISVEDLLDHMADGQVPLAILVPGDVASPLGGLGQVIDICFLLEGEAFPSGNTVTHHFQVGELVDQITEGFIFRFLLRLSAAGKEGRSRTDPC